MTAARSIRTARAEVDLGALRQNLAEARRIAAPAPVLAVVKANAYGHGAVAVARTLEAEGVDFLAVALVEEGLELRAAGVRASILVMGGAYDGGYALMVEHGLIPLVFRVEHLERLAAAARRARVTTTAHLEIDTGMGRTGVRMEELEAFLRAARRHDTVRLEGVASHFANADVAGDPLTAEQARRFGAALAVIRAAGLRPTYAHLSNSAGVVARLGVDGTGLVELVRPGLMLYGIAPASWLARGARLRPVLAWKTAITHVKRVPAGTPISYGSTWIAGRPSVIATLPVGYADGYSRMHSSRSHVIVGGVRAPIVGRVCMDMCMVDVTDVPGVAVEDEVVLLGAQGGERILVEELAASSGTIPYEVLCAVAARVPRVAIDHPTLARRDGPGWPASISRDSRSSRRS